MEYHSEDERITLVRIGPSKYRILWDGEPTGALVVRGPQWEVYRDGDLICKEPVRGMAVGVALRIMGFIEPPRRHR